MLYERTTWRADMIRCTLCKDALCSAACSKLDPAGFLRSIWFDNEKVAAARLPEENPCLGCDAPLRGGLRSRPSGPHPGADAAAV